jgi:hypothetical protein
MRKATLCSQLPAFTLRLRRGKSRGLEGGLSAPRICGHNHVPRQHRYFLVHNGPLYIRRSSQAPFTGSNECRTVVYTGTSAADPFTKTHHQAARWMTSRHGSRAVCYNTACAGVAVQAVAWLTRALETAGCVAACLLARPAAPVGGALVDVWDAIL